jgi:hypothetical protein
MSAKVPSCWERCATDGDAMMITTSLTNLETRERAQVTQVVLYWLYEECVNILFAVDGAFRQLSKKATI